MTWTTYSIKKEIRERLGITGQVVLDLDTFLFKLKIGDCESGWIKFPNHIRRDIQLEKLNIK